MRSWIVVADEGAHPRSRGENHLTASHLPPGRWLIPAHAGKTTSRVMLISMIWAHPRSRGENLISTNPM